MRSFIKAELLGFLCISFCVISAAVDLNVNKCPDSSNLPKNISLPETYVSGRNQSLNLRIQSNLTVCTNSSRVEYIDKSANKTTIIFRTDGKLFVHGEYFENDQYCILRDSTETLEISICDVTCGETHQCIKKCCPLGRIYNLKEQECVLEKDKKWEPTIYSKTDYSKDVRSVNNLPKHFYYKKPDDCLSYTNKLFPNATDLADHLMFRLLEDETIAVFHGQWKTNEYYCIDGMLQYHNEKLMYSGDESDQIVFICEDEADGNNSKIRPYVYISLLTIAIIFLILTTIVYLLLWEKHNIHGWAVFSFVISMLAYFFILICGNILPLTLTEDSKSSFTCQFVGIVTHFTFLSAMCWMSVINVDLWLTFRSLEPSRGRHKSIQRYFMYLGFAVGLPFLIVLIGLIMHINRPEPTGFQLSSASRFSTLHITEGSPFYGHRGYCRVYQNSEFWYIYLPMGILLGSNLLMFSSTVYTLWRYRQTTQNAVNSSSGTSSNQAFLLFFKLFIVMGITWLTEFVSWLCESSKEDDWLIGLPFDILNLLQSVAIFFIFAAKRENLLVIYRKYPGTKKLIGPILRWPLCRVDNYGVEQTEMTSAERSKIDRNTRVTFHSERISNASMSEIEKQRY